MKSDFSRENVCLRLIALSGAVLLGFARAGLALNEGNPYAAIAGRNVFAVKPAPPAAAVNTPPPVAPAGIELQGFSTILGRPQVLIKVKIPPRPPEPAKDRSLVLDVGQREGDVEVVAMDAYAGTVKLKNQGNLIDLNLKDNGSKPTAGPAVAAPAAAPGNMLPPPQTPPPAQALPPAPTRSLPNRQLRSNPPNGAAPTSPVPLVKNGPTPETLMSSEEQTAVIETLRASQPAHYPPLPPTELTPNPQ